jgi:signal transduction histidine kinase
LAGFHSELPHSGSPARTEGSAAPLMAQDLPSADERNGRAVAAAVGLSIAGVAPPIVVSIFTGVRGLMGPPLAADILLALLILTPAGVGLAVALSGLPRIVAFLQREAREEAEQAILRVFADTLLFGYALGLATAMPTGAASPLVLPVAVLGLSAAWTVLLSILLRPVAGRLRRGCAMALDIALLSALLHLGGAAAAGLYPLYLLAAFYAGYRFGEHALLGSAIGSLAGFAVVVLFTEFWRRQPGLALGLIAALMVLPWCVVGLLRAIAAARATATTAETGRTRFLAAVADALRQPLAVIRAGAAEHSTRVLAERISDILELVGVETGEFSAPITPFDFRAIVSETLGRLSFAAAARGIEMRWRVDPRLPPCLRGPSQAIARILGSLADHFINLAQTNSLRIACDAVGRDADRMRLRIRFDTGDAARSDDIVGDGRDGETQRAAAWEHGALTVGVVTRLVAMIGGELSMEGGPGPPNRFTITLTLGVEQQPAETDLDLKSQPVLIVSGDDAFAGEVTALLDRWHADARWIGDTETAVTEIAELDQSERSVLMVDGRDQPLVALAFADSVRRLGPADPFILFVGESSRIERLAEEDKVALDCLLPVPLTERLLVNAFRGLPLDAPKPAGIASGRPPTSRDAGNAGEHRVTPIAAHPKFVPDISAVVDIATIEALRTLGGGEAFLRELIDTFRADARQLLDRLDRAVAAADATAYTHGIAALRRCAGHLGGRRVCDLLASSLGIAGAELRQRGGSQLQQVAVEIDRLTTTLLEFLPTAEARRF